MKILMWLFLLPVSALALQILYLHPLRELYRLAPEMKQKAMQPDKLNYLSALSVINPDEIKQLKN